MNVILSGSRGVKIACGVRCTVLFLAGLVFSGCSSPDAGPQRVDVSGTVNFAGQPLPTGLISFEPDVSKGNKGPAGGASITDGKYNTAEGGRGIVGGPHVVRISGYKAAVSDDPDAPPEVLFEGYEESVDFPKETTTKDFDIPEGWKKKPAKANDA